MSIREQDWNIRAGGDQCADCQCEFIPQQSFTSRLLFTRAGYERADYCDACWNPELAARAISVWRTACKQPQPATPETLIPARAEELLRKLLAAEPPRQDAPIFVLAVMLERKRLLIEREVQRPPDGGTIRIYEHRLTGETFLISDPDLKLTDLESVQAQVVAMLT